MSGVLQQDQIAGRSLGWYDYGARFYDPALGRFFAADPLAEKTFDWSPYRYGFCNPFRFTDPDGRSEISSIGGSGLVNDDDDDDDDVKFVRIYGLKGNREFTFAANDSSDEGDEGDESEGKGNTSSKNQNPPLFDIEVTAEAGLVLGAKVKILGIGGETKLGVSKQLMKASLNEGTTYGGSWNMSAAIGAGPLGANASMNLNSGDPTIGGNFLLYYVDNDVVRTTQSIVLLDLNAYFGLGGSLKVKMDVDRVIILNVIDDYERKVDNTYVAPRN